MVSALSPINFGPSQQEPNLMESYLSGRQDYQKSQLNDQAIQQNNQELSQADYEKAVQRLSVLGRLATKAKEYQTIEERQQFAQSLNPEMLKSVGIDPEMVKTVSLDDKSLDGIIAQANAALPQTRATGEAASFNEMTRGLNDVDKEKARRVALGLDPRMQGSAAITIADRNLTNTVGESEAEIERKKKQAIADVEMKNNPLIAANTDIERAKVELTTRPLIEAATTKAKLETENKVGKEQTQNTASSKLEDATLLYNDLANADLNKVYGKGESLYPDWARSQEGINMIAKRNQLVAMLKLGASGELKGQGTITDPERQMIGEAATLLTNPDISPQLAKDALDRAMVVLRRNAGKPSGQSSSQNMGEGVIKQSKKLTYDPATGTFK